MHRPARLTVAVAAAAVALALGAPAADAVVPRTCTETLVPMDDGVRLHAWVAKAEAGGEAAPVLFMMDSYARGGQPDHPPDYNNACPQVQPDDYVPMYVSEQLSDRFTLVQVSYRGTGSSEGLFDMTGPRTQEDVRAAVAWARTQGNGDVIVVGESGTGFAGFHALREPGVKAALLLTSCPDMYRCVRRGGGYNALADVYLVGTSAGYASGLRARNALGTNANPPAPQQLAAIASAAVQTKVSDTYDAWWRQRSALDLLKDVKVPVMVTTDLYDIVGPFDVLQELPNVRFNFGMGHLARDTAVPAAGDRWVPIARTPVDRFLEHYGFGVDNGAERDPRVTLVTNTGGFPAFRQARLLVRPEAGWPLPQTRWTTLKLGAGGTLDTAPGTGSDTALLVSGVRTDTRSDIYLLGSVQPTDLRDDEGSGLTYTTPAFKRDVELSGPIGLRLFASATAADLDWGVRITDVHPSGTSEWITDGYLRASLRAVDRRRSVWGGGAIVRPWLTYARHEPLTPAQITEYELDVIPTSNVWQKGHRLRLDILPVNSATVDSVRTLGAGALTVVHDATHPSALTVPLIPDRCAAGRPLSPSTPAVGPCARDWGEALTGVRTETVRACVSRRTVAISVRVPRGGRASVSLRGRTVARLRRSGRAPVSLRGLPRGRFAVRITVTRRDGRRAVTVRRYRTCA